MPSSANEKHCWHLKTSSWVLYSYSVNKILTLQRASPVSVGAPGHMFVSSEPRHENKSLDFVSKRWTIVQKKEAFSAVIYELSECVPAIACPSLVCGGIRNIFWIFNRLKASPPSRTLPSTKTDVFIADLWKAPGSFALSISRFITHPGCAVN